MWTDAATAAPDIHVGFRGTFTLDSDARVDLRLSGASWYVVWIDGLFFVIWEIQRIGKWHFFIPFLKGSHIRKHFDPAVSMNTEVAAAFGAYIVIVLYVFHIDRLPAFITFAP